MMPETALALVRQARTMRLASIGADGAPNVAAFWYEFDGDRFCFASVENATIRNLRKDPRAAILVDVGDRIEELRGVSVKGIATVHKPKEAPEAVKRAIRRMEERWAEEIRSPAYMAYVNRERRAMVLVEVRPDSIAWFDLGQPYREERHRTKA